MQKAAKLRVEMAACSTEYKCGEASAAITREGEGPYPPGAKIRSLDRGQYRWEQIL